MRILKSVALVAVLLASCVSAGCGATNRHYLVTADYAFATAVGVFDDAVFNACTVKVLPADRCERIKPTMINLLVSVKATSTALKTMPDNGPMPKSLPDMIHALTSVRAVLGTLEESSNPALVRLAEQYGTALDQCLRLLYIFTPVIKGA